MEQEAIDERMLKTGTVPVSDEVNRLPAAANGESMLKQVSVLCARTILTLASSQRQITRATRRRRRGRRVEKAAGGDGHVEEHDHLLNLAQGDDTHTFQLWGLFPSPFSFSAHHGRRRCELSNSISVGSLLF